MVSNPVQQLVRTNETVRRALRMQIETQDENNELNFIKKNAKAVVTY